MTNNKPGFKGIWKCLLIGTLFALMLMVVAPKVKIIHQMDGQRQLLEQEKAELEKKNQELEARLKDMDTAAAVEKIAREQLGMVKKGEKIIVPLQEDRL